MKTVVAGNTGRSLLAFVITFLTLSVTVPQARAQFTANNQTNIISGVISNWVGHDYVVGSNSFDALVIQSAGMLTVHTNNYSYIGVNAGDKNNLGVVTGAGSVWDSRFAMIIGFDGAGNRLVVSNGGRVAANFSARLGYDPSASNNSALVTGAGSVWSNQFEFDVGVYGPNCSVVISNGGSMYNGGFGYLGSGNTGTNSSVIVTGSGSTWTNGGPLFVGYSSPGCSLAISAGGSVTCSNSYLGLNTGADNNRVVVTGNGSVWNCISNLFIGNPGSGNSLVISNGGSVFSKNGYVGYLPVFVMTSNNSVWVSDAGSIWSNGVDLTIGNDSAGNSLTITNGGAVYNAFGVVGNTTNGFNNSVLVTGTNSIWRNSSDLSIGYGGGTNSLTIHGGGIVVNSLGIIGYQNTSVSNRIVVADTGSAWTNTSDLHVGGIGSGNSLVVSNGGKVVDSVGYMGYGIFSSNNFALVTGAGSVWSNGLDLILGSLGPVNSLVISNGGIVVNGNGMLGNTSIASNNQVVVTGPGSGWTNTSSLIIGGYSSGNSVTVDNLAALASKSILLGPNGGGSGTLTIAGSATVITTNLVLGNTSCTGNGFVIVAGGNLIVTNAAHTATLEVRSGTFSFSGGTLLVDRLVMTNACGRFVHTVPIGAFGVEILGPAFDADGDGLPNGWEQSFGFNPLSTVGEEETNLDPDGDGMSNLQEFLAGTDPTNSASYFHVTSILRTGTDVRVIWMMGPGKTNALQRSSGAVGGSYSNNFADIFIATNTVGSVTNYTDVGAATNKPSLYYRVRLVP